MSSLSFDSMVEPHNEACIFGKDCFNSALSSLDHRGRSPKPNLSDGENPPAGGSVEATRTRRSKAFLKILGLSEDPADKITAMYVKSYPTVNASVGGAKSVIRGLAKKFQLGIVSNGWPDVQYRKLETLGIKHLFDCIVLSEEIGIRKPDPGIFWRAAELLARVPEECLYVGDSYNTDIPGAKKAGMQACWFNPHDLGPPQTDTEPDFEIRALDEILVVLDCA